jgi:exportin-7
MRQLSSVLALCIKFGWLDLKEYRDIGKDLKQFIQASSEHRIVGLQILSVVIQDIHLVTIPKYAAKFRKAGNRFFFFFVLF